MTLTLLRASFDGYCGTHEIPKEPHDEQHHFFVEPNLRRQLFIQGLDKRQEAALRFHIWPTIPENRPIPMLMDVLRRQYEPAERIETHRYLFDQLSQGQDQSVFEVINMLNARAAKTQFGASAEDRLKSRLIAGLRSTDTKGFVFSERRIGV